MSLDPVYLKKGRDTRVAETPAERVRLEYEGYKAFDPSEDKQSAAKAVEKPSAK